VCIRSSQVKMQKRITEIHFSYVRSTAYKSQPGSTKNFWKMVSLDIKKWVGNIYRRRDY